jgi:uncharacterized protein (TIGR04255 family)
MIRQDCWLATEQMKFDFSEQFQNLSHAPIVEAVIDFRAKPTIPCDQAQFENYFKTKFRDFPMVQVHNQLNYQLKAKADGQPEPAQATSSWHGLVFQSSDKLRVVQCQRDGFSFSKLQPYDSWDLFAGEALALWKIYAALTKPLEIQRLGVRFINRIVMKPEWPNLEDYLTNAPQPLAGGAFPMVGFFHNNTFFVPDRNYLINLNLALQPAAGANPTPAIILDTDVFTTIALNLAENTLETKLGPMRWLKNKIFFASLTPKLIESLKV